MVNGRHGQWQRCGEVERSEADLAFIIQAMKNYVSLHGRKRKDRIFILEKDSDYKMA